ncbi:MAG: Crp/Fnr family transcriptional regulator [Dehalococcoidales bacterium]|nr:Crp/Fnr family transcriptional regulator [Dehalococcoidales bacterium]
MTIPTDDRPYVQLPSTASESRHRVYEVLARLGILRGFEQHAVLYNMGSKVRGVYAVRTGIVKICTTTTEGYPCGASPVFPGEPFSLVEAVSQVHYYTSAVASTSCSIWFLDQARFFELLNEDHSLSKDVLQLVAGRLLQYVNQTENLVAMSGSARVAQLILRAAAEMGLWSSAGIIVDPLPTHEDIAELAGVTRSYVTRMLNALERVGIVRVYRARITIMDTVRLREISQLERRMHFGP